MNETELRNRFEQWLGGLISDGEWLASISLEIIHRETVRAENELRASDWTHSLGNAAVKDGPHATCGGCDECCS